MLEDFYGLLPINPNTFLNCTDRKVANLIMIEIPDRPVGFFKIAQSREEASSNPTQSLNSTVEIDPLNVVAFLILQDILSQICIKSPETERTHVAKNYRHWCIL